MHIEDGRRHRVIFHHVNGRIREWVDSIDSAILRGIDTGARGISVTHLPYDHGVGDGVQRPSSWAYYLLIGDVQGVGRQAFYEGV